jgi:hypothetical protein
MDEISAFPDSRSPDVRLACEHCGRAVPLASMVIVEPSMAYENVRYVCRGCFWAGRRGTPPRARETAASRIRLFALVLTSAALAWMARGVRARREGERVARLEPLG